VPLLQNRPWIAIGKIKMRLPWGIYHTAGEVASSIVLPLRTANRRILPIGMPVKEAALLKIANRPERGGALETDSITCLRSVSIFRLEKD
jgi:hypothetical protein